MSGLRTRRFHVMLTEAEYAALKRLAHEEDLSCAQVLRRLLAERERERRAEAAE